jgi:hypothetical protein
MFEEEDDDDSNSDGTVTDCEDEVEIEIEEVTVVAKKKKKTLNVRFLHSYSKELLEAMVNFDRFGSDEEQMAYVKAFVDKYPPMKPKKTTATKRSKVSYDYFRESKLRNEFKGMSIAESAPLIAQEWKNVKTNPEQRKVWDDMVTLGGGGGGAVKKTVAKDPYGLFAEEERNLILRNHPELSKDMINKECRKRWRGLEDREKGVWYAKKAKICEA